MAKTKDQMIRIYNNSKQLVSLQLRPPGGDFYTSEQQVRLKPGQDALLPKNHLREDQIENLKKRRVLRVLYDSTESQ